LAVSPDLLRSEVNPAIFIGTLNHMSKPNHNRRFISSLAIEALVPLIDKKGQLYVGQGVHPSYRMLVTHGLKLVVAHGVLDHPDAEHLRSSLDIWQLDAGKVLSLRWAPLEIVSFRGGAWADTLIEISLERGVRPNVGAEPIADLVQRSGPRASC